MKSWSVIWMTLACCACGETDETPSAPTPIIVVGGGAGGAVCQPDCAGRVCGPDGCGGTCGAACAMGQVCDAGQCVGGGCSDGAVECGGVCSTLDDPEHCGGCDVACPRFDGVLTQCIDAECYLNCPGLEDVPVSVDFARDNENCGACGAECALPDGTAQCEAGLCTCQVFFRDNRPRVGTVCDGACQMQSANCVDGCCPDALLAELEVGPLAPTEDASATLNVNALTAIEIDVRDGDRCPNVEVAVYARPDVIDATYVLPHRPDLDSSAMLIMEPRPGATQYVLTHLFETNGRQCRLQAPRVQAGHHVIRVIAREAVADLTFSAETRAPEMLQGAGPFVADQPETFAQQILDVPRDLDAWIYLKREGVRCNALRIFDARGQLVASALCANQDPRLGDAPTVRAVLPRGRYTVETQVVDADWRRRETTLWVLDHQPIPDGAISSTGVYAGVRARASSTILFFREGGDYVIRTRTDERQCFSADTEITIRGPGVDVRNDNVDPDTRCSMVYVRLQPDTVYTMQIESPNGHELGVHDVVVSDLPGGNWPIAGPGVRGLGMRVHGFDRFDINFPRGGEYVLTATGHEGEACPDLTSLELLKDTARVAVDIERHARYCARIVHDFEPGADYVLIARGTGWRAVSDVALFIEGEEQPDPEPDPLPEPEPGPQPEPNVGDVIDQVGIYNRPALAAGEEDILQIHPDFPGGIVFQTAGVNGGDCPGDTVMGVRLGDAWAVVNDDDGGSLCSRVVFFNNEPGMPTLHVGGFEGGPVPPYSIVVSR